MIEKRKILPCFPIPYPDECLYSMVARYHVRSGNPHFKFSIMDLFPNPKSKYSTVASTITMPSHLTCTDHWADSKYGLTTEYIVKNHTAIQFYAIRTNYSPSVVMNPKNCHFHQLAVLHPHRHLRYCPLCAQEQHKVYGEAYWQRLPQLRGAEYCPFHEIPYVSSVVSVTEAGSKAFTASYMLSLNTASSNDSSDSFTQHKVDPSVKKSYIEISKDITWLLANGYKLNGIDYTFKVIEKKLSLQSKGLYGRTIEKYALDVYPKKIVYESFPCFRSDAGSYNSYTLHDMKPVQLSMLMSIACGNVSSFAQKRNEMYPNPIYSSII
jgi:hypothetical protein